MFFPLETTLTIYFSIQGWACSRGYGDTFHNEVPLWVLEHKAHSRAEYMCMYEIL
jgi:hypothetical protein